MKKRTKATPAPETSRVPADLLFRFQGRQPMRRPSPPLFYVSNKLPIPLVNDTKHKQPLDLATTVKRTGWTEPALRLLHATAFPPPDAKISTSRLPSIDVFDGLNTVSTFTSGNIGPWSERAIAIMRTLESVSYACDGLEGIPDDMGDTIATRQIRVRLNDTIAVVRDLVLQLVRAEAPNALSGWEDEVQK